MRKIRKRKLTIQQVNQWAIDSILIYQLQSQPYVLLTIQRSLVSGDEVTLIDTLTHRVSDERLEVELAAKPGDVSLHDYLAERAYAIAQDEGAIPDDVEDA